MTEAIAARVIDKLFEMRRNAGIPEGPIMYQMEEGGSDRSGQSGYLEQRRVAGATLRTGTVVENLSGPAFSRM